MFTDIDEALNWVMGRHKGGMSFESFGEIMDDLGNMQDQLYVVHVAGTNGKGSTVAYLRDLLMSQGFNVGTLQSPHYLTHLDRIRFNGENMEEEAFIRLLNKYYDLFCEKNVGMFEIDYILMCEYFIEKGADIVITEVGLGGRLDSTNVIHNTKLSIITTIGYDHMERLGNTLEEICREKCGIIKNNSRVLCGDLGEGLKNIVKDITREKNSEYHELEEVVSEKERSFIYRGEEYHIASFAKYQCHNAALALEAFFITMNDLEKPVDLSKAKEALSKTLWQGRFEIVCEKPRVILDGAHNTHGIDALVESYDQLSGSKAIVFSALKRKEFSKMIETLKKHADTVVLTTFDNYEALKIDDVDLSGLEIIPDFKEAIEWAMDCHENVLVCGSLYFISEVAETMKF